MRRACPKYLQNGGRSQTTVENVSALTKRVEVVEDQILRARSRAPSPLRKHVLTEFDPRSPLQQPLTYQSVPALVDPVSTMSPPFTLMMVIRPTNDAKWCRPRPRRAVNRERTQASGTACSRPLTIC